MKEMKARTKQVTIRLPMNDFIDLKAEAEKRGTDFSSFIRQIIFDYQSRKLAPERPLINVEVLTGLALCVEVLKGAFVESLSTEEGNQLVDKIKARVERMKG